MLGPLQWHLPSLHLCSPCSEAADQERAGGPRLPRLTPSLLCWPLTPPPLLGSSPPGVPTRRGLHSCMPIATPAVAPTLRPLERRPCPIPHYPAQKVLCGLAGWMAALVLQRSEPAAQSQGLRCRVGPSTWKSCALNKTEHHILPNPGTEAEASTPLPSPNACRPMTEPR